MSLSILYDFYMEKEKNIEGEANKDEEENITKSKNISNEPIDIAAQIDKNLLTAARFLKEWSTSTHLKTLPKTSGFMRNQQMR